jgi:hypothetical protein
MPEFIEFIVLMPHPLPGRPGLGERFGTGERRVSPRLARALLEGFGLELPVLEAVAGGDAAMTLEPEGRVIHGEAFRVRITLVDPEQAA